MALTIQMLGSPAVVDAASSRAPRGRKTFALLAYLLLADRPPTRRQLAELLHPEAADPLGAVRWDLVDLRRLLGEHGRVGGDPVELELADAVVDVWQLQAATCGAEVAHLAGGQLLEGYELSGCPEFDLWLVGQRYHLSSRALAILCDDAAAALEAQRPADALELAEQASRIDPLDERAQELAMRALVACGDHDAARRRHISCRSLFQQRLGRPPGSRITQALAPATAVDREPAPAAPLPKLARARAEVESGVAAVAAGAIAHGIDRLRQTAADSVDSGEPAMAAHALAKLGEVIVHAVGSQDDEGCAVLHRALTLADQHHLPELGAKACAELGFTHVQAGELDTADSWLARAESLAGGDDAALANILGIRGMGLSDRGHHERADACLLESADRAERTDKPRQAAWALSVGARGDLVRGELDAAERRNAHSLELVQATGWTAFLPWPQSIHGEIRLAQARIEEAAEWFHHAYALACETSDHCWQAMAARGTGLVLAEQGQRRAALTWLREARRHSSWPSDRYVWIDGVVLDAACGVLADADPHTSTRLARELHQLARTAELPDLAARSRRALDRLGAPVAAAQTEERA